MSNNSGYWRICCVAMLVLSIVTFTPLVIPKGKIEPILLGLPLTLWAGAAIAFMMVLLTIMGALLHPEETGKTDSNE